MLSIKDYIKLNYKDKNIVELESLEKRARVLLPSNSLCPVFYNTFRQGEVLLTIPRIKIENNLTEYKDINEIYHRNQKVFPLIYKPWAEDIGDFFDNFLEKLFF